jgi:hypothetical protein
VRISDVDFGIQCSPLTMRFLIIVVVFSYFYESGTQQSLFLLIVFMHAAESIHFVMPLLSRMREIEVGI